MGTLAQLRKESIHPREALHLPYVGLEHIDSGDTSLSGWGEASNVKSGKSHFYSGDVLYGKLRPYLDKAVLAKREGICSTDILVLSPEEGVDPAFLSYLLHVRRFTAHAVATTTGVNHPRTSWSSIRAFETILPPLPEQQAITHILSTVQKAIETTEQVIEASRELKRSLMNHLFTYGPVPVDEAEQVPLKETEIGLIPEHWDVMKLGDVAHIGNGSTPKRTNPAYWEGGTLPWLTSGKVHEVFIKQADEFFTEAAQNECHLPLVPQGSVIVAITGQGKTLGSTALVEFDTSVSQHLAYLRFQAADVEARFVLAFLQQRYEDLRKASLGGGSTKGALTCRFLRTYPLPLPPIDEQHEVTRALSVTDRKVAVEESRRVALEILFKTLLHNLMTGKVRVDSLDLSMAEEMV